MNKQQQKNIKLIDGEFLADLLVRYEVGVLPAQSIKIYKIILKDQLQALKHQLTVEGKLKRNRLFKDKFSDPHLNLVLSFSFILIGARII